MPASARAFARHEGRGPAWRRGCKQEQSQHSCRCGRAAIRGRRRSCARCPPQGRVAPHHGRHGGAPRGQATPHPWRIATDSRPRRSSRMGHQRPVTVAGATAGRPHAECRSPGITTWRTACAARSTRATVNSWRRATSRARPSERPWHTHLRIPPAYSALCLSSVLKRPVERV